MNVVGKVGSFITQGMYSVATPFHPFGGAVDIIVVKQEDGTFRSTPWYVRFGKFQGVLKGAEKLVRIEVNGVEANFHMHLDNSGEANFVREVDPDKDDGHGLAKSGDLEARREDNNTDYSKDVKENDFYGQDSNEFNNSAVDVRDERFTLGMDRLERVESDCDRIFYEFQDEQSSLEGSIEFSDYGSSRFDNLESVERALESQNSSSEVVLVSVDGHILTAPLLSSERNAANVELTTPQFHLGPGEGTKEYNRGEASWSADYLDNLDASSYEVTGENVGKSNNATLSSEHQLNSEGDREHEIYLGNLDRELCIRTKTENAPDSLKREEVFKSCLELRELAVQSTNGNQEIRGSSVENLDSTEDPHEKSPRSPLANDRKEKENLEISTKDDAFPPTWSQVEGAIGQSDFVTDNNGCDGKHAQFVSSDEELQEQTEVDVALEGMHSGEKVSASEDESSESENVERPLEASNEDPKSDVLTRVEISLCGNLLHAGMGLNAAEDAFEKKRISPEEFKLSATSIAKNENLIVRIQGKYLPWEKAAHVVLGMVAFGLDLPIGPDITIPVEPDSSEAKEDDSEMTSTPSRRWRLWPIPFRRVKTLEHSGSNSSSEEVFVDSESVSPSQPITTTPKARTSIESPRKQIVRTNVPTTDQIESLNLKEGQNMVNFVFSTRVLGSQKVDAHIYLWKWNTRIVISDVDGTITKSDVLGQFMPLVGKDWTHSGIARLFSAIKENGYQLLFLSARAIVQAYLTKSFLFNLKQDGKSLPNGPVVISPDGLFPSLYREVIRRAPHEFKIACLEDIKALFPPDYNPFYAGFGNRDTDELSYRKIGIPKGKIFIINPKGEVAINHRIDVKSYTSLHTLVNDMFPPTALVEQEDYNSWNYWKMPLPDIDN